MIIHHIHVNISVFSPLLNVLSIKPISLGKIKRYLSLGIPVILTNVLEFSKEVKNAQAGAIVDYNNSKEFINGVTKIMSDYKYYQKNALTLSKKYYYKNIYKKFL